ncbi:MAG: autotransporter-associated beta strand repeat-containing protein, partial [Kiritimatiellia bacterium]
MRIAVLSLWVLSCVGAVAQAQSVLTYNGVTKGDWFAPNVWLNESGAAVNWQDGAVAVITNKEVTLTAEAVAYGLNPHMTGRYCVYGDGKLTLGAGGVYKTGAGEFNIQCKGGLHLSASQAWTAPAGGLVCLDGMLPFTAEDGVTLTGDSRTVVRLNAAGVFTANNTVYIQSPAVLSPSVGNRLGAPKVILDGSGSRMGLTSINDVFTINDVSLCSRLILRNGASFDAPGRTFDIPALEVETPTNAAVSSVTGASAMSLARAETELRVASGATLQMTVPLVNAAGITAALRKTGTGLLILNAANTFSGGVVADDGWVRLTQATGAGAGGISLAASSVLELSAAGLVSNPISGAGRVVKSGSGSVTLAGANDYAGGTSLSGGVTRVSAPSVLGPGAVDIRAGASLVLTATQAVAAADRSRVTGSGSVLAGTGAVVAWGENYAVAGGLALDAELGGTMEVGQLTGSGLLKTQPGKLRIAGTTGYSGEIVVSAGVLEIGITANLANGVTVRTEGSGVVQLDALDGQDLGRITGSRAVAFKNGATVAINTDTLSVTPATVTNETWSAAPLTGSADLVKTGPGTLVVSNAAAFTGRVRMLQGLLQAVGAIGGNSVTVSNGIFSAFGPETVLQNTFTVAGGTLLADNGGSLGTGTIALLAGGTLAATNSGSLGSGSLALSAGTLRMDAGGTAGTRTIAVSGSGLIQVYDGAGFDSATLTLGGGTLDFRSTTTLNKDVTLTANTTCSANTPAGAATSTVATLAGAFNAPAGKKLSVSGNGQLRMAGGGTFSGGGEIFVIGGGDLTVVSNKVTITGYAGLEAGGKRFAVADGGTVEMAGGSGKRFHAGHGSGVYLFEVLTGGVFNATSGSDVIIGLNGGSCTFRLNGGDAVVANGGVFAMGEGSSASAGAVELIAGTLKTSRQIKTGTGTGTVAFKGGILQSDGANSYDPWIATNILVAVAPAGGTIDTLGLNMKLGSSALTGPGALSLCGGGSVLFSAGSVNWAGGVTLDQASVAAAGTNALGTGRVMLGTNTLRIGANALLSNTVVAPADGGAVEVADETTGVVAGLSGGRLLKQGGGELVADDVAAGTDLAIQGGAVKVMPVAEIIKSPAGTPVIWMDASAAASLVSATSNDVSRWYDCRTPGNTAGFFATNLYNRPLLVTNALNGLPVLDFGKLGQSGLANENRMMVFKGYQSNIRSVFWVIGSRNGGGFLLGDSQAAGSARHFHRSSGSGLYGGVPSDPLWGGVGQEKGIVRAGETWTNGTPVNGAVTGLSGGYDLVSWRLSQADDAANNTPGAVWFASCYAPSDGRLNGGQELAEVLIYTNRLSEADRQATERYLFRKWFSAREPAGLVFGRVSLDGAGTGFVNAYPGPVRVAELVINAADVYVAGPAGGMSVDLLTVASGGVLDAARLTALAVTDVDMQEQATLAAVLDAAGAATVLSVSGDLTLPAAARYTVLLTAGAMPPSSALLIAAGGAVLTPSGTTAWAHAGQVSRA